MFHELVQLNYSTVIIIIFMILFLRTNHFLEKKVVSLFMLATVSVLILVIADSIEYWTASFSHPTRLRILMSAVGYMVRPAVIFIVVLMVGRKRRMNKLLLAVPLFVNTAVSLAALFSDAVFSFSETNVFIRGPLGYTPFIVGSFYIILLMVYTISKYRNQNSMESVIAIAVALAALVSMILESAAGYAGMINATAAISIVFYCMYLNAQQFKRDALTNVFNRRCFFIDAERGKNSLSALVSIDLNNLKQINDQNGHEKGDVAICEMVRCIQRVLDGGCFLYRVGGDEFIILCFRRKKDAVERLINRIRQEMKKTPYGCAIGTVFWEEGMDLKRALSIADQEMYKDKQRQKQQPGRTQ